MLLILSLIILAALVVVGMVINFNDNYDIRGYGLVFSFFASIVIILLIIQIPKPTAIDVYRGKTTLEITYKDSVPVDSIVVWKSLKIND